MLTQTDLRFVVPNIVSIDGENPPRSYMRSIVPWKLQSPIYPTIGLMISSTIQSSLLGADPVTANHEATALKARVFYLMSQYIQTTSGTPGAWAEELMGCIINLIMFEVRTRHTARRGLGTWPDRTPCSSGYGVATRPWMCT